MGEVVLYPFKVQRHQFLIVVVGEGVVGADLLQRGDVPAVRVGGLDDDHVEERPVGASSLCELHDVPAILTRSTKAWWHLILCKRIHGSGTIDSESRLFKMTFFSLLLGSSPSSLLDATGQS